MSLPKTLQVEWWRWWSNPLIGLHDDQQHRMPYTLGKAGRSSVDYFQLLQTRSVLELDDHPDQDLLLYPELIAVSLSSLDQLETHLMKVATLTLDAGIIHARPQEWDQKFSIKSADEIRKTIEFYRSIPIRLSRWQYQCANVINQDDRVVISIRTRIEIGLGLILKSYFPSLFKRWALKVSHQVIRLVDTIDPIEQGLWKEVHEWIFTEVQTLFGEINQQHQEPELEIENDLLLDGDYTTVDVDQLYGGVNA